LGRVRVELAATPEECIVRVLDNGTGIAPEERERIWEWGYSTKQPDRNTHDRGLGLFACKQIAEGHAGSIDLEASRADEGSIFVVRLPIGGPPME
jgi:sensor histidine kinase regulating citrate/malate metabolism